jgi:uncharacterized protein (DUF4415 family)
MTSGEIEQKFPLTAQRRAEIQKLAQTEANMTDIDSPDVSELFEKGAVYIAEKKQKSEIEEISFDPATLSKLRSSGTGWQMRLSEQITKWVNNGLL